MQQRKLLRARPTSVGVRPTARRQQASQKASRGAGRRATTRAAATDFSHSRREGRLEKSQTPGPGLDLQEAFREPTPVRGVATPPAGVMRIYRRPRHKVGHWGMKYPACSPDIGSSEARRMVSVDLFPGSDSPFLHRRSDWARSSQPPMAGSYSHLHRSRPQQILAKNDKQH